MTASKFLKNVSATLVAAAVCNAGQTEATLQKDDLGVDSVDDLNKMFYQAKSAPEENAAPKEFFAYESQVLFEQRLTEMLPNDWASHIDSNCKIATEIKEGKLNAMLAFGGRRIALSGKFPADFEKKGDVPADDMTSKEKLDDAKVQSTLITLQLHAFLRQAVLAEDATAGLVESLEDAIASFSKAGLAVPEAIAGKVAEAEKMANGKLKDLVKKLKEQKKSEAVKAAKDTAQAVVTLAKQKLEVATDADEKTQTQLKKAVKDAEEQVKVAGPEAEKHFVDQQNHASTLESLLKQLDNGDAAKDPKKFLSTIMHRGFLDKQQELRGEFEAELAREEEKKTPDAARVKDLKAQIALCDKRIAYLNSQLGYGGMATWLLVLLVVLGVAVIGAALYFFVFANKEDSQQRLPSHEGDLDDSEEEELTK